MSAQQTVDEASRCNFELQPWLNRWDETTAETMIYKSAALNQMIFARDWIAGRLGMSVRVVSTHRSKSIELPVYRFSRPGLEIVARDNFYDWKISALSDSPLVVDLTGLCHTDPPPDPDYTGDPLHGVYFEGFPEALVFGYYDTGDHTRWSMEIRSEYEMFTACLLILRAAGGVKAHEWPRRREVTS